MIFEVIIFFLYHQAELPVLNPELLDLEPSVFPLDYDTSDNLPTYLKIYT